MPDQPSSTETPPFRTEPSVVDPGVYLDQQLETPFYFPPDSTDREGPELAGELIEELEEKGELGARQLLEAIYHPDERVLLSVIDDTRGGASPPSMSGTRKCACGICWPSWVR